ncbi:hypothetical protein AWM79_15335 [Pseudomonas agarici]|uniref:Uncharacterized protein n=1 Tax=Pseudomonas agarici TaxID=46677 RepID=A0A0X1T3L3_PSEAA|nr:hypothetical protein AWM79_15335 [Pseudomonas agarici]
MSLTEKRGKLEESQVVAVRCLREGWIRQSADNDSDPQSRVAVDTSMYKQCDQDNDRDGHTQKEQ